MEHDHQIPSDPDPALFAPTLGEVYRLQLQLSADVRGLKREMSDLPHRVRELEDFRAWVLRGLVALAAVAFLGYPLVF